MDVRLWIVPFALLLLGAGGCGTSAVLLDSEGEPSASSWASPSPSPPFDPEELADRLVGLQPQWPRNTLPRSPGARGINCRRVRCVALTFDDGPGEYTGRLLDILARHRARATFFVLGRMAAEDRGENLRRMVTEGHEIGNHTWNHLPLTQLSPGRIRFELVNTQKVVRRLTGVRMTVMRPPYGSTNAKVAAEARREGLAQVLWDVDTLDWRDRNPSLVTQRATQTGPGSIVLMHDIHPTTVEAVPAILDQFAKRGYAFVTLSELYGVRRLIPGRQYTSQKDGIRGTPPAAIP
ncbi:polysaccharide deacetylase family protein [Streptosporangium sp. NPDC051022]|uniref:polysaccharide deacetylase family protein n=1 Tax=Streptosporangium sp. NPDC051022 TaxID=3155752 RepID=UPI00341932A1